MSYEFKIARRVEFSDTDMAGIVHFSNFFRFMEAAEHAYYRSLGCSVKFEIQGRTYSWPRVHAECNYEQPLRFEDLVEIHLLVREKNEKSINYNFILSKLNEKPKQRVARGSITVVCVELDSKKGKMRSAPIPEKVSREIEVAPKELLD